LLRKGDLRLQFIGTKIHRHQKTPGGCFDDDDDDEGVCFGLSFVIRPGENPGLWAVIRPAHQARGEPRAGFAL
jgi:hypothetical protein